ncbi:MAG: hypothetical protein CMP23_11005 [Rickettsiales bacterium]|nr:hypothetical protein [Rickettsiales bacterium]|tara:strand:- start:2440 stop:4965 length:2526 start_codon:yes stop_codon:yes gene_type:complete
MGQFCSPGAPSHYAPDLRIEPIHLDITLRFDLAARSASAQLSLKLVGRSEGAQELSLDAVDLAELTVLNQTEPDLQHRYDGRKLQLFWAEPFAAGEERTLTLSYRIENPLSGMLFYWPDSDGPSPARAAVTDNETERARYWLACIDHPNVRTTVDFHLRGDPQWTYLANGAHAGQDHHEDGSITVHWKLEQPCPSYLLCVAVGELVRAVDRDHDGLPIEYYATGQHDPEDLLRSFGPTAEMLRWMEQRLGLNFPYPKYFQLAAEGIGGAMENISLVTWDDVFVADERLHREWGWLIDLINLHEMAHSYFGDLIVVRDYSHVWLKESWATYMESVWLGDCCSEEAMLHQLHEEQWAYMDEADKRYTRPIVTRRFDSSWDMYDRHLYPGGAVRLHMLRVLLGERDFWSGVQSYVASYAHQVVETADFRRCLEQASGRSLARFFEQWFHSPGYPKLKIQMSHDPGRCELLLKVEQTQEDSEQGIGLFDFELEFAIEAHEGEWLRRCLRVAGKQAQLVMSLPSAPLQVVVDPQAGLVHRLDFNPGDDLLKRSVRAEHNPYILGRIQAAIALCKSCGRSNLRALSLAWENEPSWGVKMVMARALGDCGAPEAPAILAEKLLSEKDPRLAKYITEAAAQYRSPVIAAALRQWLQGAELPYLGHAGALRALAEQRAAQDLPVLRSALQDQQAWGLVRRGALQALGRHRSKEAMDALLPHLEYGADKTPLRCAAVEALGATAAWLDRASRAQALDLLRELIRDPQVAVRAAAGRALLALGEPAGLTAMETLSHLLPSQEVPRLRKAMGALRKKGEEGPLVAGLRKELEQLEGRVRGLGERLETLEARER